MRGHGFLVYRWGAVEYMVKLPLLSGVQEREVYASLHSFDNFALVLNLHISSS